jgi:hypothetical protein
MAIDTTPEIERLVAEIQAAGNYAGPTEVIASALRELQGRQRCVRKLTTRRQKLALVAWAAYVLATIVAVAACAAEVESIVVTFPVLAINGLALVLLARPLYSWPLLAFGIAGPLVSVISAGLIIMFQWRPGQASGPVLAILCIYASLAFPAALFALRELLNWSDAPAPWWPVSMQFSLKSLLVLTTALCVVVPLVRFVIVNRSHSDFIIFGLFILITISFVGVAIYVFLYDRRRPSTGHTPVST